jgi:hypothetical protein
MPTLAALDAPERKFQQWRVTMPAIDQLLEVKGPVFWVATVLAVRLNGMDAEIEARSRGGHAAAHSSTISAGYQGSRPYRTSPSGSCA